MNRDVVLIAHNVRSAHNVGSLLRTADGMAVDSVYLTGYTPYPEMPGDQRLPHERQKVHRQIHKTALGAEASVTWYYLPQLETAIERLKKEGYVIAALEQTPSSTPVFKFEVPSKIALLVGNEVDGLTDNELSVVDMSVEIPMLGKKESFNVALAAAIALYHCRYSSDK